MMGLVFEIILKKKFSNHSLKLTIQETLNQGGSGLGLSIANELVKKLNGKIYVKDSKKKEGSIFIIDL